jgi:ribosomal protein S18 acetylase RimI-like enzyme
MPPCAANISGIITVMKVRVGNAGDFAAVVPMMRKYRSLHEQWDQSLYALRPDAEARFQRWIGPVIEDPRSILLVAEANGKIIGFLTAIMEADLPIYECEQHAMIMEFWVDPEFRRHGAGKALIDLAAKEYAAMGITQLRVRTAMANDAGREMLEHAGFRAGTIDLLRQLKP